MTLSHQTAKRSMKKLNSSRKSASVLTTDVHGHCNEKADVPQTEVRLVRQSRKASFSYRIGEAHHTEMSVPRFLFQVFFSVGASPGEKTFFSLLLHLVDASASSLPFETIREKGETNANELSLSSSPTIPFLSIVTSSDKSLSPLYYSLR